MQYASSGSLEDYINSRANPPPTVSDYAGPSLFKPGSAEAAKAAFRARRKSSHGANGGERTALDRGEKRGVRLLGREEIEIIFGGVVKGLSYLVRICVFSVISSSSKDDR